MEQGGDPQEQGHPNYDFYDAFGAHIEQNAGEDGGAEDVFLVGNGGGWDQHHHENSQSAAVEYQNVNIPPTSDYEHSAHNMDDYADAHQYGHEFDHQLSFHGDTGQFHDFMGHEAMEDQHIVENQGYEMNQLELYNAPSIYPNLDDEHGQYVEQIPQTSIQIPQTNLNATVESPSETQPPRISTQPQPPRSNFKFTAEQRQAMLEKFDAGLHYPSNQEKESLAQTLGVSTDSVSRWFERTRKEKGVQRNRKALDQTPPQPQHQSIQSVQQNPAIAPSHNLTPIYPAYSQFPSTYPYNTVNPQLFQQGQHQNIQPAPMNTPSIMYAPIPSAAQFLHQPAPNDQNPQWYNPAERPPSKNQFTVEIKSVPINKEGVYVDDTRDPKRAKLALTGAPKEIAPRPLAPKVPKKTLSFEEEVTANLHISEWKDDAAQAAEDLYDLMVEAEDVKNTSRKLFLLRRMRTHAPEIALKSLVKEEHLKILAKIRNWFTAAFKENDKTMLTVILELIKKMNLDGRTMGSIKLGKPLVLLMKKDEPTLKAQLASIQKAAYEAYAYERDAGLKPAKADSPVTTATPNTTSTTTQQPATLAPAPAKPAPKPVAEKPPAAPVPTKIKAPAKPQAASFFGKLAQTANPTISKLPPIPKKVSAPSQSLAVTASGAAKPPPPVSQVKPPPKPTTSVPAKPASTSKFSVLEYIKTESSDKEKQAETADSNKVANSKKRKRVSWAPEESLENVKMIENITLKYADDLFWYPPQEFGNARDMDIGEGRAFGKDTVEYDVEEEIEWYEPKAFDFSSIKETEGDRGVKRAGRKPPEGTEAENQKAREKGVLLITYLNDGDIPESPSEPFLEELLELQKAAGQPVKAIPLPMEVRGSGGNAMGQIGPVPTPAVNPNVTAILSSLLGGGQAAYPPSAPVPSAPVAQDLAALLQSLTSSAQPQPQQPAPQPVVQNIPPNIDLSAILSQLQQPAQPLPTTQRWTSPPPSSSWDRREERTRESDGKWKAQIKREPGSRIKATRADDIRESVRNSSADQNVYRALCQFFKTDNCRLGDSCTFVHPRDMSLYDQ